MRYTDTEVARAKTSSTALSDRYGKTPVATSALSSKSSATSAPTSTFRPDERPVLGSLRDDRRRTPRHIAAEKIKERSTYAPHPSADANHHHSLGERRWPDVGSLRRPDRALFYTKLHAEHWAREMFPTENVDKRYARIQYRNILKFTPNRLTNRDVTSQHLLEKHKCYDPCHKNTDEWRDASTDAVHRRAAAVSGLSTVGWRTTSARMAPSAAWTTPRGWTARSCTTPATAQNGSTTAYAITTNWRSADKEGVERARMQRANKRGMMYPTGMFHRPTDPVKRSLIDRLDGGAQLVGTIVRLSESDPTPRPRE